jgi:serine/threonine protein kinase
MGDIKLKIKQNKVNFKNDIEPEVKQLITQMLQVDPKRRPTVTQILNSSFFTKLTQSIDDQFFSNPTSGFLQNVSTNRQTKKKNFRSGVNRPDNNFSKCNFMILYKTQ